MIMKDTAVVLSTKKIYLLFFDTNTYVTSNIPGSKIRAHLLFTPLKREKQRLYYYLLELTFSKFPTF